jgi:beta-N-acetylhexosaminidase
MLYLQTDRHGDPERHMPLPLEQALGQQFLLSFNGKKKPSREMLQAIARQHVGGVVLFRAKNMGSLADLRGLNGALQAAARKAGQPPLLIAADQEGGQLMAFGEGTPFPGNMALGATRSEDLARRVGRALGLECAALGINVDFAPVADVNNNPANPVVGTRSFGEQSRLVSRLGAAMIAGLQSAGVAATAKHFPGHGDTASDSHHGAPILPHRMERLKKIELPPFRAAIRAGVKLIMTAHIALPSLNEGGNVPATLSRAILTGLLRRQLKYDGIIVTDALDMHALDQGPGLAAEAMAAIDAGADLVLFNHDLSKLESAFPVIAQAARRGFLSTMEIQAAARRILALKTWLAKKTQPPLSVVGCRAHLALAREVARESVTLVRDNAALLPLRLPRDARVLVVVPRPEDLTPADTSSYLIPSLAPALRRYHARVDETQVPMNPDAADVRALREKVSRYDLAVVGTINATAHRGQAELVSAAVTQGTPTIAVALRMPYDLTAYPSVGTYVCTYGILPPSMEALAAALCGRAPFAGRLPVTLPR